MKGKILFLLEKLKTQRTFLLHKNIFSELKFRQYKYVVNVVMGEQRGAGIKMGTRCIWDAEADSYAFDNFVNVRIKIFIS